MYFVRRYEDSKKLDMIFLFVEFRVDLKVNKCNIG